jgi:hypothetical protein
MIAVALALEASTAAAGTNDMHATAYVDWSRGSQNYVIVNEALWRCRQDRCVGVIVNNPIQAVRACRQIRRYGSIRRFVIGSAEMAPEQLQRCNR